MEQPPPHPPDPAQQQRLQKLFHRLAAEQPRALEAQLTALSSDPKPEDNAPFSRLAAKRTDLDVGGTCGPFRILEKLGEGGMGAVYLAGRDELPEHRVALKTLSAWHPDLRARFEKECRILAGLKHDGIAHLVDAGVLSDGQPWFAMEYVPGTTLDGWIRQHQPDLKTRLHLFLKICEAVIYAHQQMVIHRDLKPGNIMVQDSGTPKLLDFGIAKMLDAETGTPLTVTNRTDRILTPQYASPEQVNGERLGTASDVYSLGVILYELLTDRLPYHFRGGAPLEIMRVINQANITRPSKLRGQTGHSGGAFTRQLRGDLDTITLKALAHDRNRRYAAVDDLAADIRRYLTGMPITARQASTGYRFRKFIKRHPWPVAAVLGMVASLSLFSVYATVQNQQTARQRDLAEQRLASSQRLTGFLVSMFEQIDPDLARNHDISALEVMEAGRRRLNTDLDEDPAVKTLLLNTLARVYASLGRYDQAEALLVNALESGDPNQVMETRFALIHTLQSAGDYKGAQAQLHLAEQEATDDPRTQARLNQSRGHAALLFGRYPQAQAAFDAVGASSQLLPPEEQAQLIQGRAQLATARGHYDRAIQYRKDVLALRQRLHGRAHSQVASALASLSLTYLETDQRDQAKAYMDQAETLYRDIFGEKHPHWVNCLQRRGQWERLQGNYDQARELFEQARDLALELLGEDHPWTANVIHHLAVLNHNQGDFPAAEALYRQTADIRRRILGANHPALATCLGNLAYLKQNQSEYDAAEDLLRQAISIQIERLGEQHPDLAESYQTLALIHQQRGRYRQAEPLLHKALSIKVAALGENHQSVGFLLNNLAGAMQDLGKLDGAERLYQRTLTNLKHNLGDKHRYVAGTLNNLGSLSQDKGDYAAAENYYRQALDTYLKTLKEDHPAVGRAQNNVAMALFLRGDYAAAEPLFRASLATTRAALGEDHPSTAVRLGNLGRLLLVVGKYAEAEPLIQQALPIFRTKLGKHHRRVFQTEALWADLNQRRGDLSQAKTRYETLFETLDALPEATRPRLAMERAKFAELHLLSGRIERAEAVLTQAEKEAGEDPAPFLQAALHLARAKLLRGQGDPTAAEPHLEQALALRTGRLGEHHPLVAAVRLEQAEHLAARQRWRQALETVEGALAAATALPEEHESRAAMHSLKGLILTQVGEQEAGQSLMRNTRETLSRRLGEGHYLTREAQKRLIKDP
ncbi:serine/threonine-protein kinase [Acanthopleuribacter pedis]|uniref:Tetratricopeptide repeat protein n=1 Tax=Acanthopleuribacter pedis TaxID=442870 RepID=A0A8J7QQJ0_9BACT|nr:serine/threonine-protein kinase [Acanthopleuribacter pedis]MBO1322330.1 tetratricopeptide repeat protein [Acanthopleuribacter pedis]